MNRAMRRRIAKVESRAMSKNVEPRRARRKLQHLAFKMLTHKLKEDQTNA